MIFEEIKEKLYINFVEQSQIREEADERYEHTLGVIEAAEDLAEIYKVDVNKAKIAALLHDCAKFFSYQEFIQKYNIAIPSDILAYPKIVHAFMAPYVAKYDYGVNDEEILNATKYHTTGRPNMGTLEKIIFVADAIEPSRAYDGIEEIRIKAKENLDTAVLLLLKGTIEYVEKRGLEVFNLTKEAYEWYKKN